MSSLTPFVSATEFFRPSRLFCTSASLRQRHQECVGLSTITVAQQQKYFAFAMPHKSGEGRSLLIARGHPSACDVADTPVFAEMDVGEQPPPARANSGRASRDNGLLMMIL